MKKGILFFTVLLFSGLCFAQTSDEYNKVNSLLKAGLNKNFALIQNEASNLDEVERSKLYDTYSIGLEKKFGGMALDFFIGFGTGNFLQKDYLGGGIALGGDLLGLGFLAAGVVKFYVDSLVGLAVVIGTSAGGDGKLSGFGFLDEGFALILTGGIISLVSRTFGFVRAYVFPSAYNNKLGNALNVNGLVVNIEPSLDITKRGYELTLVRLQF
jgi:hypothetical protein